MNHCEGTPQPPVCKTLLLLSERVETQQRIPLSTIGNHVGHQITNTQADHPRMGFLLIWSMRFTGFGSA